jgi:hypothetical protein
MQTNNTNVQLMAREAADEYLESGDLNKAVAKVASARELNPQQIQRVVEATNHEVNARTYKSAEDKRFALKLASVDDVMKLLGGTPAEQVKEASADSDFFTLRRTTKTASKYEHPHRYREMGGQEGLKQAVIHDLKLAEAAVANCCREVRTQRYAAKLSAETALAKFGQEVKRLMRDEGVPFQEMYKASCTLFQPDLRPLVLAAFETVKQENIKHAAALEGKELAKFDGKDYEALGGRIVNGDQPLFIHLKVVCKDGYSNHCCGIAEGGLNSLHSGLVTAIHALKTNKDTDDYIAREVQPFANNVRKGVKFAVQYVMEHAEDDTWLAKTAGFLPVAKMMEQASRVAQFLNQVIKAGGTGASLGKNFFSDIFAPAVVGSGYTASTAGWPREPQQQQQQQMQ